MSSMRQVRRNGELEDYRAIDDISRNRGKKEYNYNGDKEDRERK